MLQSLFSFKSLLYILLLTQRNQLEENFEPDEEYDFVIVGGGTSGSVVAGRLSEDPNSRILVLEAGGSDKKVPQVAIPPFWPLLMGSTVDWNYENVLQRQNKGMNPTKGAERRTRGKVLGGSSSINGMMYIRGSPHDYDSWEDHGATGWGWKDVEPYFRKLEGATEPDMSKKLGRDGPVKLTPSSKPPLHTFMVDTASQLGYNHTDYLDNLQGISSITLTTYSGIRQNAATAYLHPVLPERKERLHILLRAHATKIVMRQERNRLPKAVGVNYMKDGKLRFVKARKEVIVCAGSIETPHLLMLSGIGPKEHLDEMKVKTVVNLTGVGSNFQDHQNFPTDFHATNMPRNYVFTFESYLLNFFEYVLKGTGQWNFMGTSSNLEFRTRLDGMSLSTSGRPFPDIQLVFTAASGDTIKYTQGGDSGDDESSFHVSTVLVHPKSAGTIRLKSNDPQEHPLIDPNFLSNNDDMKLLIEGIKRVEEFETSVFFKRIGAKMMLPSQCKIYHEENAPRNDRLYECLVRARITSFLHSCCTAKIGSAADENAVVDSRLRVYGIKGLRIADASVMPHITSSNTMSPCYMIGEKAADMIKEDWKL